jgi:hypothetical protein
MKEVLEHINTAYQLTGTVLVNDQNLDRLAAARQALLMAYHRGQDILQTEEARVQEMIKNGEILDPTEEMEVTEDGNDHRQTAEDAE